MDNSSLFGEIIETGKTAAKHIVKSAAKLPIDVGSTAVEQISGKSGGSNQQDPAFQQQINQLKQQDAQDVEAQMAAIRRNLAQMNAPKPQSQDELPKYISGKPGAAKTIGELEELNKEAEKKKKKIDELPVTARKGMGTGEGVRGMTG